MEIPVINRISDFETGITSLQNPSFLSQIFALSGVEKIHQAYSFWKWGALLLALVASFTTIINRFKILVIRFKNHPLISSPSLITNQEDYDYESETDLSCSSSISLSDEEQEEESLSTSRSWRSVDDRDRDFRVRGSGNRYIDAQWQKHKCDGFSAVSPSPSVVVSAETNLSGHSSLSLWDSRVGFRMPEVFAELRPILAKVVGVGGGGGGGVKKVYVRDDVTGELTVGDLRKVSSPLVNLTESDVETWWDADAVIVQDECEKSV
ncbi:hypothetical protein OIU79_006610 [Salix purpurea]|uniref:Uncharacterized protein n=1 Tax=Salix purpurea TaxID=77065 RepID=A0A9Q0TVU0_SALPP|nr:hypothetical protein OIU79_006610 [Salix purpurea]